MFTGIVERLGKVKSLETKEANVLLEIETASDFVSELKTDFGETPDLKRHPTLFQAKVLDFPPLTADEQTTYQANFPSKDLRRVNQVD